MKDYDQFLKAKQVAAPPQGFSSAMDVSSILFPFQRRAVEWALARGCAALFESYGLGKSLQQLEIARHVQVHTSGRFLIIAPLGVRAEFARDAKLLGVQLRFVRATAECSEPGVYITNYESVRDGKLDPRGFDGVSLDEADVLRGLGGTKTFREFMRLFEHDVRYRFVATATPSPNEHIELLAYAAFLGVADVGQMKTRFFKRNSEKADNLTIHPHKEAEFWLWVASWALFATRPSDIDASYSDAGYDLPPLNIHWHELVTDHSGAGAERDGQLRLIKNSAYGVVEASREKRSSLDRRVSKVRELTLALRGEDGKLTDQPIVWCDLNDEQEAIAKMLATEGVSHVSLRGNQDVEEREELLTLWKSRSRDAFVSKPVMYGAGVNLQQSATEIFAGIGFKAKDVMQAMHRIHRFLQTRTCNIHFVYTDAEREIRRLLEAKMQQHEELVSKMTALIREHGLAHASMREAMIRSIGVTRREVRTDSALLVNNDCVIETRAMESNSVDMIVTSIPFSTQYEYTPSYNDFGHTDNNGHFWEQMGFLIPELLRVLRPGRVAAIHVKDRIVPGGLTGLGFQTVYPFSDDCVREFQRHGFAFLARKTIVTDVVRENNQTYRLGWTEQCKDGSRMGNGMPEYLLVFRKPPTDGSNGYADVPVTKSKEKYSRGRWQLDAHGYMRSSGNRLLAAEDLIGVSHERVFKLFRAWSLTSVTDHEHHVKLCETLDGRGMLPVTFMLLQPQSWHEDVWTDVTRMRTLNGAQSAAGREMHLCPLQFDIVDRCIEQYTMPGETVLDPFGGLGTVAYCAIKQKRRGVSIELNPRYHTDAVTYARSAEREIATPTLFDLDATTPREEVAGAAT